MPSSIYCPQQSWTELSSNVKRVNVFSKILQHSVLIVDNSRHCRDLRGTERLLRSGLKSTVRHFFLLEFPSTTTLPASFPLSYAAIVAGSTLEKEKYSTLRLVETGEGTTGKDHLSRNIWHSTVLDSVYYYLYRSTGEIVLNLQRAVLFLGPAHSNTLINLQSCVKLSSR